MLREYILKISRYISAVLFFKIYISSISKYISAVLFRQFPGMLEIASRKRMREWCCRFIPKILVGSSAITTQYVSCFRILSLVESVSHCEYYRYLSISYHQRAIKCFQIYTRLKIL